MKTLEELNTDHSTFSIGKALTNGWGIVKQSIGFYILGGILTVLIGMLLGLIPFVGGLANQLIVSPCLMAGAVFVTWRISKGIAWTDLGDMFKGFKYLTPIMVSSLIQIVVMIVLAGLFLLNYVDEIVKLVNLSQGSGAYRNQDQIKALFLSMLSTKSILVFIGLIFVLLFVTIIWIFKSHFIVIYNMQGWPAMEMSRKIATRNFLPLFGFFVLIGLIVIISIIPCGAGLLFSLPLSVGATYSVFAQITHCDQPDEINKEMFDFIGDE